MKLKMEWNRNIKTELLARRSCSLCSSVGHEFKSSMGHHLFSKSKTLYQGRLVLVHVGPQRKGSMLIEQAQSSCHIELTIFLQTKLCGLISWCHLTPMPRKGENCEIPPPTRTISHSVNSCLSSMEVDSVHWIADSLHSWHFCLIYFNFELANMNCKFL